MLTVVCSEETFPGSNVYQRGTGFCPTVPCFYLRGDHRHGTDLVETKEEQAPRKHTLLLGRFSSRQDLRTYTHFRRSVSPSPAFHAIVIPSKASTNQGAIRRKVALYPSTKLAGGCAPVDVNEGSAKVLRTAPRVSFHSAIQFMQSVPAASRNQRFSFGSSATPGSGYACLQALNNLELQALAPTSRSSLGEYTLASPAILKLGQAEAELS